jgi:hypothetical protein
MVLQQPIELSIGLVLLRAAAAKLRRPLIFVRALEDYHLSGSISVSVAAALIVAETFLTIAHLTGFLIIPALWLGLVLFIIFTIVNAVRLSNDVRTPCHCFGADSSEVMTLASLIVPILLFGGELALLRSMAFPRELPLSRWWIQKGWQSGLPVLLGWTATLLLSSMWVSRLNDIRIAAISSAASPAPRPAANTAIGENI